MTWLREVAVPQLLGGISALLGGPSPAEPPPPPPADPHDLLTAEQKAQLTYAGVDPTTAPMGEINRVLQGLGEKPLPQLPAPAPPPPSAGLKPPGDGFSGAVARAAGRVDDALQANHSALNDADAQLADAILRAGASDEGGKARLRGLQQEVVDEVAKLDPTLDTPAGQAQLADFLQGKTAEVLDVVTTAGLDAASHAAVLDALTARYQALGDRHGDQGEAVQSSPVWPPPPAAAPAAAPEASNPIPNDPSPASDWYPQMPGLPMLGSMAPPFTGPMGGGGGELPLGDLGATIGSAIRDAARDSAPNDAPGDKPERLQDQPVSNNEPAPSRDSAEPAPLKDQQISPAPKPQAGPQSAPAPGPPETTVKLPDGTSVTTASPAVAAAGKAVLAGTPIADAYQQAGVTLPAPGSTVTAAVSPSQLVFGDVGEFTDHRVMALGGGKVFVNGQVCPLEQLDTGPNFLGWEHPTVAVANGR